MTVAFPLLGQLGRLGNQLWQVASTVGLAAARGEQPGFPIWAYMDVFSVPHHLFHDELPVGSTDAATLVPHIDPRAAAYLQDYSLWSDVDETVRRWFTPSVKAEETLATYTDFRTLPKPVLGLHVRRGDNFYDPGTPNKHLWHPMPPLAYYLGGVEMWRDGCASLAVFSDDPQWCQENIPGADYIHIGTPRPKEHEPAWHTAPVLDWIDLMLFAECDLHVISNSSYAWWGAYLSNDRVPTYPWPWYGPNVDYVDATLMFPPAWYRLEK